MHTFQSVKNKAGTYVAVASAAVASGVSSMANAALPAAAGTALTAVETDGLALIDLVWPVVGAITVGFILIKLFKRGASAV